MKSPFVSLVAFFALTAGLFAQPSNDPVIMTIDGKPVLRSEFEYIYNKNNSNNSLDKKTLNEYVDLFINFKLKVQAAEDQGIDTTKAFINELSGYRSQLTKPYLTDQAVEDSLVQEAYNRMKEDVDVSHILIRLDPNASPTDTAKAWQKINQIAQRLKTEDFSKVAKEESQDPSVKQNGGHIGWISAFRTIYPFECAAYNTPVGKMSKPFRTAFGYHIIKVNGRRKSLGEVLVSHIMTFTAPGDSVKNKKAKLMIDSIYQRIKAGDDFAALAKKYSEDKGSALKGGELPWFGTGRMVPEFEQQAFALKDKGDISKPFESPYGWHIVKLIDKRGIDTFEKSKADIEQKIKRDERGNMAQLVFINKLKKEYNPVVNNDALKEMAERLGNKSLTDSTFRKETAKMTQTILTIRNKKYSQADFAEYLKKNSVSDKTSAEDKMKEKFSEFEGRKLLDYEDSQLENKYADFRSLMQEYHDGILLFDISNSEVWDKASKDTAGLDTYFKAHRDKYKWDKPHFKGYVIYCKDQQTLKQAQILVKQLDTDSIDKYLRKRLNDSIQYVKTEKGLFVKGDNKAVDYLVFKTKDKYVPDKNYPYVFVSGKVLRNKPEDYLDVRGLVTADYQDYLEKQWIKELREKYPVVVNWDIVKTVKQN